MSERYYFTAGVSGVSASQEWASLPEYENWEHVIESFQTILHCGNCFNFPLLLHATVYPKAGNVQLFMQNRNVLTLEFVPNSLASCRMALMVFLRNWINRFLAIERPKQPAELSHKGSKVLR